MRCMHLFWGVRGPIDEVVLHSVRRNVRGQPVDVAALNSYIVSKGGPANYLRTNFPLYLSNTVLHPQEPNWVRNGNDLPVRGQA